MNTEGLERQILELHSGLSLKPTVEKAIAIGQLFREAKARVPYGEWQSWTRRLPFSYRTTALYLQLEANSEKVQSVAGLTFDRFLNLIKKNQRRVIELPPDDASEPVAGITLHHADSYQFRYPRKISTIITDPPWRSREAYIWLAEFAATHLEQGGILAFVVSTQSLPDRVRIMEDAGLRYQWCSVYGFSRGVPTGEERAYRCANGFTDAARFVLVYSRGDKRKHDPVADFTVLRGKSEERPVHKWQQPVEAFERLMPLAPAKSVVCDPFAGAGTTAIAAMLTGRRFLGCEKDESAYTAARQRIAQVRRDTARGRTRGAETTGQR